MGLFYLVVFYYTTPNPITLKYELLRALFHKYGAYLPARAAFGSAQAAALAASIRQQTRWLSGAEASAIYHGSYGMDHSAHIAHRG
jgi:hypothetical protein